MEKINYKKFQTGFTLIELLVVISIIGFLTVLAIYNFSIARMQSRDVVRAGNIATLSQALAMYINDNGSYPMSAGECLKSTGAGADLLSASVIITIPTSPLWPDSLPSSIHADGYAQNPANNFCYYYSSIGQDYYLSYYLETSSKSGAAGIHVITAAGEKN